MNSPMIYIYIYICVCIYIYINLTKNHFGSPLDCDESLTQRRLLGILVAFCVKLPSGSGAAYSLS